MAVATPTFTGFRPEAIQFLVDLAANNERSWFQPRKAEYERLLKEPLEALCVALDEQFRAREHPAPRRPGQVAVPDLPRRPLLEGQVAVQDPRGGELRLGGRRRRGGGRPIPPRERPRERRLLPPPAGRDLRRRWRLAPRDVVARRPSAGRVVDDLDGFRAIVEEPAFKKTFGTVGDDGESLKRVPPGYPADHPAADLLRLKNVTFGRRLSDDEATEPEAAGRDRGLVRGRDAADALPRRRRLRLSPGRRAPVSAPLPLSDHARRARFPADIPSAGP